MSLHILETMNYAPFKKSKYHDFVDEISYLTNNSEGK
jgi:hypothetical protein